jgi:hypothetical protein
MRITPRYVTLLLGALVLPLLSCVHDSLTRPDDGEKPIPGVLVVRLSTPNTDDAALLVTVTGPVTASGITAAAPGTVLHLHQRGDTTTAALFGSFASGPLLHLAVPDVRAVDQYTARIVEVADDANVLRSEFGGYAVAVER